MMSTPLNLAKDRMVKGPDLGRRGPPYLRQIGAMTGARWIRLSSRHRMHGHDSSSKRAATVTVTSRHRDVSRPTEAARIPWQVPVAGLRQFGSYELHPRGMSGPRCLECGAHDAERRGKGPCGLDPLGVGTALPQGFEGLDERGGVIWSNQPVVDRVLQSVWIPRPFGKTLRQRGSIEVEYELVEPCARAARLSAPGPQ